MAGFKPDEKRDNHGMWSRIRSMLTGNKAQVPVFSKHVHAAEAKGVQALAKAHGHGAPAPQPNQVVVRNTRSQPFGVSTYRRAQKDNVTMRREENKSKFS